MPGSTTTPGPAGACAGALGVLPSAAETASAPGTNFLSRLNGWPIRTPVNASRRTSRCTAHDSGTMWFATSLSSGTCTLYSLPVSRRTSANIPSRSASR